MTVPNPRALVEPLVGHRVTLTLTTGRTRTGSIVGCGPDGLQITSGIGGRMLYLYGDIDGIEDLGPSPSGGEPDEEDAGRTTEHPSETVTIQASPELLATMRDRWSEPVEVRATYLGPGRWDMTFRTHTCAPPPLDDRQGQADPQHEGARDE